MFLFEQTNSCGCVCHIYIYVHVNVNIYIEAWKWSSDFIFSLSVILLKLCDWLHCSQSESRKGKINIIRIIRGKETLMLYIYQQSFNVVLKLVLKLLVCSDGWNVTKYLCSCSEVQLWGFCIWLQYFHLLPRQASISPHTSIW